MDDSDRLDRAVPAPAVADSILAEVAGAGADDAGGVPVDLLGDFLPVVATAVVAGRPVSPAELDRYRNLGNEAARRGVALRALLDLYLSAGWRLWRHLPPVIEAGRNPAGVVTAGEVMLHAVDDVVAVLAEGYQLARRALVRAQEAARREFVDDLLNGAADVVGLLHRATGFGLDLSGPHAVAVVQTDRRYDDAAPLLAVLERAVAGRKGDAQALLASKQGRLVVVFPAPDPAAILEVVGTLTATLEAQADSVGVEGARTTSWQVGVGRPGTGADGVATSYREAGNALELAARLGLATPVVDARELLVYSVLLQDRTGLADLVASTLRPLRDARGGAAPLIDTLSAFFAAGGNSAAAARSLHLSVRAVNYRLDRVRDLTGHDPLQADDRFALQVAVLGAKLLDWPHQS